MSRRLVYRAIYIPSLLALAVLVVAFAHPIRSRTAFTPAELTPFAAEDKSFRIDYPRSWKAEVSTLHGTGVQAHFHRDEDSEVVVTCDLTGSLMMDITRSSSAANTSLPGQEGAASSPAGGSLPPGLESMLGGASAARKTPLQTAHASDTGYMRSKFRHYKEDQKEGQKESQKDDAAVKSEVAGGEALTSAFTAQTPDFFNPKDIVGKHITVLIGNRPVTINAYCPKGEEQDLFKILDIMLKTLRVSETGGS